MARRRAGKAKPTSSTPRGGGRRSKAKVATKTAAAKAVAAEAPSAADAALNERLAALERECAALREELERERSRRQALEQVHAATRDRIAWALDSLQAILEAKN